MPFNIGPMELILLLAIALIVFGPGKLPEVGKSLGASIREFRKAATDMGESMKAEATPSPVQPAALPTPAQPAALATPPAPAEVSPSDADAPRAGT